ncbi:MAG TPA: hypothetical protein EYG39_03340, partial [Rhodothermales bacterium]|nr:hypothetical protein [Rhodothermales bacterium]
MSGYGTTPDSALAEARAILADVHTRTGHLSRSLDQPGLATAPDDEPHLAALLRQALRRIAVETGRVHVTASVSVETSEAWVELPGVLTGARIAQAVWEYASGRRALQVEHPNGVFVSTASGRPTIVRVGPEA